MQFVYGVNPLLELIKQGYPGIKQVIVATGRKGPVIDQILLLASTKRIPVIFKDKSFLDRESGGSTNQGIAALCEDYTYVTLDEIIENRTPANIILILDSVTDPQNLGALIRTAHCLGVKGVVIPENRAVGVTPAVIKASAGAAYWLAVAREVNLPRTIEHLKEEGFWVYGTDAESGADLDQFADTGPVCLVMGSEGRGLRPLIKKKCDLLLSIPMTGKLDSLNVSVAAGIILYEIVKKQAGRK